MGGTGVNALVPYDFQGGEKEMVFSSLVFLCIFLPVVFVLYTLLPGIHTKNFLLLIASLVFYAYGEPVYVLLLLGVSLLNYLAARLIASGSRKKAKLAVVVILNLGILCLFKYTGFLVESLNQFTGISVRVPQIELPIGISFYIFQALSYVIDVYREEEPPQKNFATLLLYISFFPQLIAGPIVKYRDIASEILDRKQTPDDVAAGIRRFTAGLGKKVLIANFMAQIADAAYGAAPNEVNILVAWLGAAAYMLQIYFDFSGYSDMAIGLGRMFGFHFKENFCYPYTACGIRDFWRRWHISLSSWFRDYLYIPLGGNRRGKMRTCLNKMLVFLCTGFWHGANFTFLFWGFYHGCFLMLEEYVPFFRQEHKKRGKIFLHLYTLLVVLTGFVFFRADTMSQAFFWIRQMVCGFHFEASCMRLLWSLLTPAGLLAFAVGIAGSLPLKKYLENRKGWQPLTMVLSLVILVLCLLNLSGGTYNPFIYFRF